MSYTELHIGKLRKVELKENQSNEDFYKEKLLPLGITNVLPYCGTWEEIFRDHLYEKYVVANNIIYEIFDHVKKNADDGVYELVENSDETLSFIMQFHNGGTCLLECIEEKLENSSFTFDKKDTEDIWDKVLDNISFHDQEQRNEAKVFLRQNYKIERI